MGDIVDYIREQFDKGRLAWSETAAKDGVRPYAPEPDDHATRGVLEEIGGRVLREILETSGGPHRALKLRGFVICGSFDLSDRALDCLVSFSQCVFRPRVNLQRSSFRSLRFDACRFCDTLELGGVRVDGDLSLTGGVVVEEKLYLNDAKIGGRLDAGALSVENRDERDVAASLQGLATGGDLLLNAARPWDADAKQLAATPRPAEIRGALDLSAAEIRGRADLHRIRLAGEGAEKLPAAPGDAALRADRLSVMEDLHLYGLAANSYLSLRGARIGGALTLSQSAVRGASGLQEGWRAVDAEEIQVGGSVALDRGDPFRGDLRFVGARIEGSMSAAALQVAAPKEGRGKPNVLDLKRARLVGDLRLTGFGPKGEAGAPQFIGRIDLRSARIGGDLVVEQARLRGWRTLLAMGDGLHVAGDARVVASRLEGGRVELPGAVVGGSVEIAASVLDAARDQAVLGADGAEEQRRDVERCLDLSGARIGGAVSLSRAGKGAADEEPWLVGGLSLAGASVGRGLHCARLSAEAPSGASAACLDVTGAVIGQDVVLENSRLVGAVDGTRLQAAEFRWSGVAAEPGAGREHALVLARSEIRGRLGLYAEEKDPRAPSDAPGPPRPAGAVDLSGASARELDDTAAFWRETAGNDLDGLDYAAFGPRAPTSAAMRLGWLRRQKPAPGRRGPEYLPQAYRRVSTVLRRDGHSADGLRVAFRSEALWGRTQRPGVIRALHWWFGLLTGYGYRLGRAALALALLFGVVAGLALAGWRGGVYGPRSPDALASPAWLDCAAAADGVAASACWSQASREAGGGEDYEPFNAGFYALDVVIPLLDLDQENAWGPMARHAPVSLATAPPFSIRMVTAWNAVLEPIASLFGWVLSAFIAAGLSRSVLRG